MGHHTSKKDGFVPSFFDVMIKWASGNRTREGTSVSPELLWSFGQRVVRRRPKGEPRKKPASRAKQAVNPRWVTTSQRTALLSKPALCRFFHALRRCSFPQKACAFQGPHGFAPSFFDVMIKWASEDSEWSAGDRKGFYAKFSYQTR